MNFAQVWNPELRRVDLDRLSSHRSAAGSIGAPDLRVVVHTAADRSSRRAYGASLEAMRSVLTREWMTTAELAKLAGMESTPASVTLSRLHALRQVQRRGSRCAYQWRRP